MANNDNPLFYCIIDAGDGSASLRLFTSNEALNLYLALNEKSEYCEYDLSEGGGFINPADAMDIEAVKKCFSDEE